MNNVKKIVIRKTCLSFWWKFYHRAAVLVLSKPDNLEHVSFLFIYFFLKNSLIKGRNIQEMNIWHNIAATWISHRIIHLYMCMCAHVCIYIYIYMCVHVCVCVCVCNMCHWCLSFDRCLRIRKYVSNSAHRL